MNTNQTPTTVTVEVAEVTERLRGIRQDFAFLPYTASAQFPTMPTIRGEADILAALDLIRDILGTFADVLRWVAESHRKTEAELKMHRDAIAGLATLKRLIG